MTTRKILGYDVCGECGAEMPIEAPLTRKELAALKKQQLAYNAKVQKERKEWEKHYKPPMITMKRGRRFYNIDPQRLSQGWFPGSLCLDGKPCKPSDVFQFPISLDSPNSL